MSAKRQPDLLGYSLQRVRVDLKALELAAVSDEVVRISYWSPVPVIVQDIAIDQRTAFAPWNMAALSRTPQTGAAASEGTYYFDFDWRFRHPHVALVLSITVLTIAGVLLVLKLKACSDEMMPHSRGVLPAR